MVAAVMFLGVAAEMVAWWAVGPHGTRVWLVMGLTLPAMGVAAVIFSRDMQKYFRVREQLDRHQYAHRTFQCRIERWKVAARAIKYAPPRTTSIRSTDWRGMRSQYTHPPKGSLSGMRSERTTARLAPLAPTPLRDTPCVVGLAVRLPERRNRLKPGT